MDKFQNKYRIPSARAQWWDYGWNGAYFITICTQNRQRFFGEIACGRDAIHRVSDIHRVSEIHRVSTTPAGEIAHQYWYEIPDRFPFAELGDFIVMPNHVHGIIIIDKPIVETRFIASNSETPFNASNSETPFNASNSETRFNASNSETRFNASNSETRSIASLQQPGGFAGDKNPMLNDNISKIIRWYKGRCSFEIRKINSDFKWQSRFHDHIIRNDKEYQRISDYIVNNPDTWKNDKFNT